MTRAFRSTETDPAARGREFGARHAARIRRSIELYGQLFDQAAGRPVDMRPRGQAALSQIGKYFPALLDEIAGMAAGAQLDVELLGAINARTEILASLRKPMRGECSTVVRIDSWRGESVAVQTWDWYSQFADQWLVWEIPLADGRFISTLTEYGIVGKAGASSRGLGLLFNILHHTRDGDGMGVPVHVLARAVLEQSEDINAAIRLVHGTPVTASSCLTVIYATRGASAAVSLEVHPGGPAVIFPDEGGLLVHTNHFLAPGLAGFDTEPAQFPDTLVRYDLLRRRLRGRMFTTTEALAAMDSHLGTTAAVCAHPDPAHPATGQYATLATLVLDLASGSFTALTGGPCENRA